MPLSISPASSSLSARSAMKPRKILPGPMWTHLGCVLVCSLILSISKEGISMPAALHSERCFKSSRLSLTIIFSPLMFSHFRDAYPTNVYVCNYKFVYCIFSPCYTVVFIFAIVYCYCYFSTLTIIFP